jgi:hypothetical protein
MVREKIIQLLNENFSIEKIRFDMINEFAPKNAFKIVAKEYVSGEDKEFFINLKSDSLTVLRYKLSLLYADEIKIWVAIGRVENDDDVVYQLEKMFFEISYNISDDFDLTIFDIEPYYSKLFEEEKPQP